MEQPGGTSSVTQRKIKEAVKSALSEEGRLHNAVLFGLRELPEEGVHEAKDEEMVEKIMEELNNEHVIKLHCRDLMSGKA